MRGVLKRLRLAVYGGDELLLALVACGLAAWALYTLVHPHAAWAALPPLLLVVWFFRDPERAGPDDPLLLLSPADGEVRDIEIVDEPRFFGAKALRVGIFLSPLNVHVNRAPCAGTVAHLRFAHGEFLPAYNPDAATRNEAQELGLVTPAQIKVMVKQVTGVVARRIVCEARMGQRLARGERYGMIKFGSRTELYVPSDAGFEAAVELGQQVRGGTTVLLRQKAGAARPASSDTAQPEAVASAADRA